MRYFLISYGIQAGGVTALNIFGHQRSDFPTLEELQEEIRSENSELKNINSVSVLSISELTKGEYNHFWSKK